MKSQLLSPRELASRLGRSVAAGFVLIAFSLSVGMAGYHWIGELSWIDAFLDSAMILSGMGPLATLHSDAAKLFAGFYAIYCGIMLIATTGVMFGPLIHRSLHKFHLEWGKDE